jgi:general secretion pathway protein C
MKRMPLVASFLLFVALCASIAYWGMQMFKPAPRPVAAAPQIARQEVHVDAVAALFGGRTAPIAVASNYQLKGVVMSVIPGESVAIVSADGKPPQTAAVNKEIMPGVVVKEVHPTYVMLSEGGVTKRVELPDNGKNQMGMGGTPPGPEQQSMAPSPPPPPQAEANPANPGVVTPVTTPPPPQPAFNPMSATPITAGPSPMAHMPQGQPPNNGVVNVPPPQQR